VIVERPALERRILASCQAGRIPVLLGGCTSGRTSTLLRLWTLQGRARAQYLDVTAAATTPERCLASVLSVNAFHLSGEVVATTTRASFEGFLRYFDLARTSEGAPGTFLLDEFLDLRTFESFPGLRHVQREFIAHLAASPATFVLASRFTARTHRLLRDAPARFEVIHIPPLDTAEVQALAMMVDGHRRPWMSDLAPGAAALAGGRAGTVALLLHGMTSLGAVSDPVGAMAALFAPDGTLTARCRESYEGRLQRARGYGALKAILGILAATEPLNLTEIAQQLGRTPGSTKDYLSWLEDVDLVTSQGKRYAFEDPLLRVYVRLYGRPVPPTDDDVVREVGAYAKEHLPVPRAMAPLAAGPPEAPTGIETARSGIIEID
jgi:hypothetical protein